MKFLALLTALVAVASAAPFASPEVDQYPAKSKDVPAKSEAAYPPKSGAEVAYPPKVEEATYPEKNGIKEAYPTKNDAHPPMSYNFSYAVKDEPSYNDFGHQETSDGEVVTGSYYVILPDSRKQIVTYRVDHKSGYVATVKYEGEAKFPENKPSSAYKPTYPAPKPIDDELAAAPSYPASVVAEAAYPKPVVNPTYPVSEPEAQAVNPIPVEENYSNPADPVPVSESAKPEPTAEVTYTKPSHTSEPPAPYSEPKPEVPVPSPEPVPAYPKPEASAPYPEPAPAYPKPEALPEPVASYPKPDAPAPYPKPSQTEFKYPTITTTSAVVEPVPEPVQAPYPKPSYPVPTASPIPAPSTNPEPAYTAIITTTTTPVVETSKPYDEVHLPKPLPKPTYVTSPTSPAYPKPVEEPAIDIRILPTNNEAVLELEQDAPVEPVAEPLVLDESSEKISLRVKEVAAPVTEGVSEDATEVSEDVTEVSEFALMISEHVGEVAEPEPSEKILVPITEQVPEDVTETFRTREAVEDATELSFRDAGEEAVQSTTEFSV